MGLYISLVRDNLKPWVDDSTENYEFHKRHNKGILKGMHVRVPGPKREGVNICGLFIVVPGEWLSVLLRDEACLCYSMMDGGEADR
jgi:hypothetical protein